MEGLVLEDVGIFYGNLVNFTVFCYILGTFGIIRGNLVYIFPVLVFCTKKNLATLYQTNADQGDQIGRFYRQLGESCSELKKSFSFA
jgi:hypothetical protein